jgi:hypothetical protein
VTIVNRRYNYIFVHVPKAAGKSVKQHLVRHSCGPLSRQRLRAGFLLEAAGSYAAGRELLKYIVPPFPAAGSDPRLREYCRRRGLATAAHLTAQQLRECLGEADFSSMFTFAFVRNPWDRCLSAYFYFRRKRLHPLHRMAMVMSYEDFLEQLEAQGMPFVGQQSLWLFSAERESLVDYIGRVEDIGGDMARVHDAIGLRATAFSARTNVSAERDRDYRAHYTARAQEIVARAMRDDIELLGYSY